MLVGFSTSALKRIMSFLKTIRIASIRGKSSLRDALSVMRSGTGPCSLKTPPAPPLWQRERWVMLTGCFPESAYTEACLKGKKTWVRIPRDQWPPEWLDSSGNPEVKDQVVVLVLALCAGTFWEQHCEAMLKQVGYVKVKGWAGVFRHEELDLFLVVYVGDFKMSGPAKNIAAGWALISKVIKMEEPRQLKRYLGCEHEFTQQLVKGHFDPRLAWTAGSPPDKLIRSSPT